MGGLFAIASLLLCGVVFWNAGLATGMCLGIFCGGIAQVSELGCGVWAGLVGLVCVVVRGGSGCGRAVEIGVGEWA